MGKCRCGNETDNYCESLISDGKWYKCPACFNKEWEDGLKCTEWTLLVMVVLISILIYITR